MHTSNIIIVSLALVASVVQSRADSAPPLPSEFAFTLEARSGTVSTNKWGYTWSTNCCPPVARYYKQQETTNKITLLRSDMACTNSCIWWSGTYADRTVTRSIGPGETTNLLCEGTFTAVLDPNGPPPGPWTSVGTRDCGGWTIVTQWNGGAETNHVDDFFGSCGSGYYFWYDADCDQYWWWWGALSGLTECTQSTDTNAITGWLPYTEYGDCVTGTNVAHVSLSDEFTTAELIQMLTNNITTDYLPCGNISPHATASILEDESWASGQAVEARFKVFAPTNEHWEINFERCRICLSNGVPVVTRSDDKIAGLGTGGWIYTNITLDAAFSTYTSNNCLYYRGAETWIEVGCANNLGCAGGSCGLAAGSTHAELHDGGARVVMGLGPCAYGEGSASLLLMAARPGSAVPTPASLEPYGNCTGATLLKSNGHLRQALTPLGILADIIINSASSFTVNFYSQAYLYSYPGEDGLYTVEGLTPFASTTIAQGATTNQFLVTAVNGSTPKQYVYDWSGADQGWSLTSGGGLRKESHLWNEGTLTRTLTVKNVNNQTVSQESKTYVNLAGFGRVLGAQTLGPGTSLPLTSQWFYYDNAPADGIKYGKLKKVVEPSGFWRSYQDDTQGRLTNEMSQFLNAPTNAAFNQCRSVTYDYTSLDGTNQFETRTEWLAGSNISRTITATLPSVTYTIRCASPSSTWTNSANLVTATRYYTDGENAGKIRSVSNPDGTAQVYAYDTDSSSRKTTTWSGAADGTGTNVVLGTRTESYVYSTGAPYQKLTYDLSYPVEAPGTTPVVEEYHNLDDLGRVTGSWGTEGTTSQAYDCCGLYSSVDRQGTTTFYLYDDLRRQVGTMISGITRTNLLDAAGNVLATRRVGSDSSTITLNTASYDTAGRLLTETNALGGVTTYSESRDGSGQTIKTTTYADGGQRIETFYQDGSLRSVTGTAAFPVYYAYGVDADGVFAKDIKDSEAGTEWTKTCTDYLGRNYKTLYADNASSASFYNSQGQLWKQIDPDGVSTLYQYNSKGQVEYTAIDMNTNGLIDFAGADRITRSISDVYSGHNADVRRTRTYVWSTLNSSASNLVSTVETSTDGLHTWSTISGLTTETTTTLGNGQRQTFSYAPDLSYTLTTWQDGQLASVARYDSIGSPLSTVTYGYDSHGRQYQITDARMGTTTCGYNNADLVTSVTTPNPGTPGGSPQTTLSSYNKMLQVTNVVNPDGASVTNEYHLTGTLKRQFGSLTYPVGYGYDYAGRMKTMTNWSGFPSIGARVTTWNYGANRGWLTGKTYQGGVAGPSYTYTAAGRLQTRTWARGVTTTNTYNWAGALASVSYSDSTPDVTTAYDRLGRIATTIRNGITNTLVYDTANDLLSESFSGGTLAGLSVTNGYDQYLRRTQLAGRNSGNPFLQHAFSYDDAARLQTVTDNSTGTAYSATYSYLPNSPLVSQIEYKQSTTTRMTTSKQYDYLNRLLSISSAPSNGSAASYNYSYNSANQRIRSVLAEGSYWLYTYDSLGQVIAGNKYWADGTPVAGQQFDYTFDTIGNRTAAHAGGDQNGGNLRSASYSANTLNHYTSRTVPGAVDVMGVGFATNAVAVNNQTAYRKGEYYRQQLTVNNASTPVWQSVTNAATGQTSVTGAVFVAKNPENFYYDQDGNLTNDGRWRYAWDAENRLITLTTNTAVGPQQSIKFEYDSKGRRIHKQVWSNPNWSGTPTNDVKFVYDGWNLLAELNATNNAVIRSFMWGTDLSGFLQGAGGVGGLLEVVYKAAQTTNCFVAFDGNGNVAALIDGASENILAQYEYDPFGEILRATGPMAKSNPFRFSTKYQDDETDLLYYGLRYLKTATGGWLSRDPIGERGGLNVYGFVGNSPGSAYDRLGLSGAGQNESGEAEVKRTRTCKWSMYFGHLSTSLRDFAQRRNKTAVGDRYGYKCCSHDWLNQLIPESARLPIPLNGTCGSCDTGSDRSITDVEWNRIKAILHDLGIPIPDRSALGYCALDYETDLQIVRDLVEAMKGECGSDKSCCKKIKLTVSCGDDALEDYIIDVADWRVDGENMGRPDPLTKPDKYAQWKATSFQRLRKKYGEKMFCGKTVTIDCRDLKMKGSLLSLIKQEN